MSENIYNYKIITDADMSSSITSSPSVDMSRTDGYAVYAKWTGAPVGDIKLQASVDNVNFVDIIDSDSPVNGPGDIMWEVTTAFYDKFRVVYTRTSGTGVLNAQINGKGDLLA